MDIHRKISGSGEVRGSIVCFWASSLSYPPLVIYPAATNCATDARKNAKHTVQRFEWMFPVQPETFRGRCKLSHGRESAQYGPRTIFDWLVCQKLFFWFFPFFFLLWENTGFFPGGFCRIESCNGWKFGCARISPAPAVVLTYLGTGAGSGRGLKIYKDWFESENPFFS